MKKYYWFGWENRTCAEGIKEVTSEEEFQKWMTEEGVRLCAEYGAHSINCSHSNVRESE